MIDLGFEEDVNWILETIPSKYKKADNEDEVIKQEEQMQEDKSNVFRIMQMYSATMPGALEKLAKKYLKFPLIVMVGRLGSGKKEIEQRLEFMTEGSKKHKLIDVLSDSHPPIMVFVNQKKDADSLARYIENMTNLKTATLHSDKVQEKREKALNGFKNGSVDVLVCTNLASRGLDVEGITHVVNYDAPTSISDYTHRIGRTGRAGKKGIATTFLTTANEDILFDLRNFLVESGQKVPQELSEHPAAHTKRGIGNENAPRGKQTIFSA